MKEGGERTRARPPPVDACREAGYGQQRRGPWFHVLIVHSGAVVDGTASRPDARPSSSSLNSTRPAGCDGRCRNSSALSVLRYSGSRHARMMSSLLNSITSVIRGLLGTTTPETTERILGTRLRGRLRGGRKTGRALQLIVGQFDQSRRVREAGQFFCAQSGPVIRISPGANDIEFSHRTPPVMATTPLRTGERLPCWIELQEMEEDRRSRSALRDAGAGVNRTRRALRILPCPDFSLEGRAIISLARVEHHRGQTHCPAFCCGFALVRVTSSVRNGSVGEPAAGFMATIDSGVASLL
jgi:hypothetical protein